MKSIAHYFDLGKQASNETVPVSSKATVEPTSSNVSPGWQAVIYCTLVLAVLASRYLDLYRAGLANTFVLNWPYLLAVAIIALVVFPTVYEKALSNRTQPIFMQLTVIFAAGMGWEKLLATASGR
jgi:hypothetical protein